MLVECVKGVERTTGHASEAKQCSLIGKVCFTIGDTVAVKALTPRRRAMLGIVSVGMAAGLATFDSVRISHAWRLIGGTAKSATVWGGLSMIATAAVIIWADRRSAWTRDGNIWRAYRWAFVAWAVALMLAFYATHPRWGSDQLTSNLAVGVTTYTAALFSAVFLRIGLQILWPRIARRPRTSDSTSPDYQTLTLRTHDFGDPHHQAEVWHVHLGRDEPDYYIAHCDCDWVGTPYDKSAPDAEQSARREANSHTAQVAPVVVEI